MEKKVGKEGSQNLYDAWIKGTPLRDLQQQFQISRQRIYQILKNHRKIGDREKMLRAVNKFSH